MTLMDHMGSDLSVVNAARVSFDKESELVNILDDDGSVFMTALSQADTKLISYLARHKHTSPFNHCFATFRIKAPIFVARQLVKHKFMPWNEVSRRYVDSEPEFYFPEYWRKSSEDVKQGSSEEEYDVTYDIRHVEENIQALVNMYSQFIGTGMCAEQARMILPQNMMTEWIWSGTLGAFADMCRLRLDSHTQLETRQIAEKINAEMLKLYPVSWAALMEIK